MGKTVQALINALQRIKQSMKIVLAKPNADFPHKEKKPDMKIDPLFLLRGERQRSRLASYGVKDTISSPSECKTLLKAQILIEGDYNGTRETFIKNDYMHDIETLAGVSFEEGIIVVNKRSTPEDKLAASLALGNLRIHFAEFADRAMFPAQTRWVDEILMVLGTDENPEVRAGATHALNMNISYPLLTLDILEKTKD